MVLSDHGQTHVDRHVRLETSLRRPRRRARHRVEPGGDGLPGSGTARQIRGRSRNGSTRKSLQRPCCFAKERRRLRAATARSCASRQTMEDGTRVGTKACSAHQAAWSAPGPRCTTRTPAESLSQQPRDSSSQIWPAVATTPAASHGSLPARRFGGRLLTIGIDAQPHSIVEIAPAVLRHFGVASPAYARTLTRAA